MIWPVITFTSISQLQEYLICMQIFNCWIRLECCCLVCCPKYSMCAPCLEFEDDSVVSGETYEKMTMNTIPGEVRFVLEI